MSIEDYIKVEESLFADTEEEMDREYYENEVSEVDIPNPEEASKKFIEKYGEEGVVEDYEEIEDDGFITVHASGFAYDEKVFSAHSALESGVCASV